jgi:hypothetical protein
VARLLAKQDDGGYGYDGLALQELKLGEFEHWEAKQILHPHVKMIISSPVKGPNGWPAGGVGFAVRKEHWDSQLFTEDTEIEDTAMGTHGLEKYRKKLLIRDKEGVIGWTSMYMRSRNGYETAKLEHWRKQKHTEYEIVMGDMNASTVYCTETLEIAIEKGIGFESVEGNRKFEKNGNSWVEALEETKMMELSATGDWTYKATRYPRGAERGGPSKLDMIAITDQLKRCNNPQMIEISDPLTPIGALVRTATDHCLVSMNLDVGIHRARVYKEIKERYKIDKNKPPTEAIAAYNRRVTSDMDAIVEERTNPQVMNVGEAAITRVRGITKILKDRAESVFGKVKTRFSKLGSRTHTRKHGTSSQRELMRKETLAKNRAHREKMRILVQTEAELEERGEISHARLETLRREAKNARNKYMREIARGRNERKKVELKRIRQLPKPEQIKAISSKIREITKGAKDQDQMPVRATMKFEGREIEADTEEGIREMTSAYTHYVSMNQGKDPDTNRVDDMIKMKCKMKQVERGEESFNQDHYRAIEERVKEINKERMDPKKHEKLEINQKFTWKEFENAVHTLRRKLHKTIGKDGIHNWMLVWGGETMQRELFECLNDLWENGAMPEEWNETLISYIYKGKGSRDEMTNYRPIGLTSAIVNLMKKMILVRLTKQLFKHMSINQGGFRKGIGGKEQLWALVEEMEEAELMDENLIVCTTDVHKAFDQVYRNGTIYLLYANGVRGKMLEFLVNWMTKNIAFPTWRGVRGKGVRLNANGLRQGCNLSPILYLLIIDTMISKQPDTDMPAWDKGFLNTAYSQGVQNDTEGVRLLRVLLFVDDTALTAKDVEEMEMLLERYYNFTRAWRIRVNASKCAVMQRNPKEPDVPHSWKLGEERVPEKTDVKYLGIKLSQGKNKWKAQRAYTTALAVQARKRVRTVRETLGESWALHYVRAVETPKILFGAELTNISPTALDEYQAWVTSEALGIGRREKSEGFQGLEPPRFCVFGDCRNRLWRHEVAAQAMRTVTTLKREKGTLPGKVFEKLKRKSVLEKTWLRQGVKPNHEQFPGKRHENESVSKGKARALRMWETFGYKRWKLVCEKQQNCYEEVEDTNLANLPEQMRRKGRSLGALYCRGEHTGESLTRAKGHTEGMWADRDIFRRLRAGQVKGLKATATKMHKTWRDLTEEERSKHLACSCAHGGPQDTFHIVHECEDTYAQINKILMDYEQLMKSKGLAKLLCDWRGLSRKGKIDELMCMEGSHLYSSREDGKKLTNWVVKRVAEMTSDFEQGLQEKEAP